MSTTAESVALPALRDPAGPAAPGGDAAAPPARARDVELLGQFARSGHRRPPSLVRRADGQTIQLTPLLYEILRDIDGRRTYAEIAESVGARVGRIVTAHNIRVLTESKLRPLGLLRGADGMEPVTKKANPLLALRLRQVVTSPRITNRIASLFSWLFAPPLVLGFALAFIGTTGWLLFDRGLGAATRHALYEPGLLLFVFALTTLSAGFHELGHAAACRYSGATPGVMGIGLYLVWPAFYTDVSDSYRLDRSGRLRVDLGGIYFNAIFGVAALALWAATGWEALLVVIALQMLQMLRQLIPLVRLDGYHILADLTGVPDLFAHIKPILRDLIPIRSRQARTHALKPRVRVLVTAWVLVVVPLLASVFVVLVLMLPRLIATAWDSMGLRWGSLQENVTNGHLTGAGVEILAVFALAIPILSVGYLIARVVLRTSQRVWHATDGRPVRRLVALIVAACLVAGLMTAWWPDGQYRPIQENERGILFALPEESWPINGALASANAEQFSAPPSNETQSTLLRSPSAEGLAPSPSAQSIHPATHDAPGVSFPLPRPPEEGDNQALAVNTKDGTTLIEIALSLVFTSDEIVDNSNEAYALASCVKCVTVAIALQVVVILDQTPTFIPENVAAAVNAECAICLTVAVATQLIVTLTDPLSGEEMSELETIWKKLMRLEAKAHRLSLDEILTRLTSLQEKIAAVLGSDDDDLQAVDDESMGFETETTSASPDPSASASPSPSPSPSPSSSPSPSPSPSPSGSASSDPSPTP